MVVLRERHLGGIGEEVLDVVPLLPYLILVSQEAFGQACLVDKIVASDQESLETLLVLTVVAAHLVAPLLNGLLHDLGQLALEGLDGW